jgi:hypothetical protein
MAISAAQTITGSNCQGQATSALVTGIVQIGASQTAVQFPTADIGYAIGIEIVASGGYVTIDLQTGIATPSAAYVAGTAQVETATVVAASGCTSNGNCTLTLTSAAVVGTPLSVVVPLTTASNTATLVAAALAAGLAANAAVSAAWTVTSSGADILLTRKSDANGYKYANEAFTNLAIPSGLGITAAPTSYNTTPGVVSSGVNVTDGDGKDFEGVTLVSMARMYGLEVNVTSGAATAANATASEAYKLPAKFWNSNGITGTTITGDLVLTSTSAATNLTATVIGKST